MNAPRGQILIRDLTVHYRVGVPEEERAHPQKLQLTVELDHDFTRAAAADDLGQTLDYYAISQKLLQYGEGKSWKLIETLAVELAEMILREFRPARVAVEVKKFIIVEAAYVSVRVTRP